MEDAARSLSVRARAACTLALLAAAAQCGCKTPYIGTTAASFMSRVRQSRDPNIRYVAYGKLASSGCYENDEQKAEAVKLMIKKYESGQEPVASRAVICRTLGELHAPSARPLLLQAVNDPEGVVRAEACRALGKIGRSEDATILARVMNVDTLEDCRIAAIEALGGLKSSDPRINVMLVEGMEHEDPAIRLASLRSLRLITGKDFGPEPAPWRDFVMKQQQEQAKVASSKPDSTKAKAKAKAKAGTAPTVNH